MAAKFKLDWSKWNSYVSDTTQCTLLPHDEAMKFLSSKDPALAQYLEKHPEMAHELMIPSGFKQRMLRRYERYLGGQQPALDEAKLNAKAFDAMLPGSPKVISNSTGKKGPSWRELNAMVCANGKCTLDGEAMAPQYMYGADGKKVHVIKYGKVEVEVTPDQWHMMWDHVVCGFARPVSPADVELVALHEAYSEVASEPVLQDWKFPGGQQAAIILKQLEHRMRAGHKGRPNPCAECCPWRSTNDPTGTKYKQFLTKEEATELVIDDRNKRGDKLKCIYDPVVYKVLKKRGVEVPANFLKWSTAKALDATIARDGNGSMTLERAMQRMMPADQNQCLCCGDKDYDCSEG